MPVFILLTLGFSFLLVGGQILWKQGIVDVMGDAFTISKIFNLIIHPKVLVGGLLYAAATLVYFYLQSRYAFSKVQLVTIPLALFFSMAAGLFIFNESLSRINYLGVILIFIGVLLLAAKVSN